MLMGLCSVQGNDLTSVHYVEPVTARPAVLSPRARDTLARAPPVSSPPPPPSLPPPPPIDDHTAPLALTAPTSGRGGSGARDLAAHVSLSRVSREVDWPWLASVALLACWLVGMVLLLLLRDTRHVTSATG